MAHGGVASYSHRTATDPAMVQISVSLDTSIWTKRKRKIVTRCITSGILDAGARTIDVIADIMATYGIGYRATGVHGDRQSVVVPHSSVDPDRLTDLLAVVMARLKIKRATGSALNYSERNYLDEAERMAEGAKARGYSFFEDQVLVHKSVPLMDFMPPDYPHVVEEKAALCALITNGEIISCNYQPHERET